MLAESQAAKNNYAGEILQGSSPREIVCENSYFLQLMARTLKSTQVTDLSQILMEGTPLLFSLSLSLSLFDQWQ